MLLSCRQRQFIALGNRVPTAAPDTWVAPNAVIVGDVDLYDRVGAATCVRWCRRNGSGSEHTRLRICSLLEAAERMQGFAVEQAFSSSLKQGCSLASVQDPLRRAPRERSSPASPLRLPPANPSPLACLFLRPLVCASAADQHLVRLCAAWRPEPRQGWGLQQRAGPHSDYRRTVRPRAAAAGAGAAAAAGVACGGRLRRRCAHTACLDGSCLGAACLAPHALLLLHRRCCILWQRLRRRVPAPNTPPLTIPPLAGPLLSQVLAHRPARGHRHRQERDHWAVVPAAQHHD